MADNCHGPACGSPSSWSTTRWIFTGLFTLIVAFAPILLVFVGPQILRIFGSFLGWTLRKKTEGRRALLVGLMDEDNKRFAKSGAKSNRSSDDWEKVQGTSIGGANEAAPAPAATRNDWDGIVGFFHPFWYFQTSPFNDPGHWPAGGRC
jgi:alpha-1,2-mannosyltransferase